MWPFTRTTTKRTVLLEMYDGNLVVAGAIPSQAGFVAQWCDVARGWSVLMEGGAVRGTSLVRAWLPHGGWRGDEFATWPKGSRFGSDSGEDA